MNNPFQNYLGPQADPGIYALVPRVLWVCMVALLQPSSAQAAAEAYFICPDRLITNQLGSEQAAARGCQRLSSDGLSVVSPQKASAASVLVSPAAAEGRLPAPAKQRGTLPKASRAATPASPSLTSTARKKLTASRVPAPGRSPARPPSAEQRARDSDSLAILQSELERTLLAQKRLGSTPGSPSSQADLHRLRVDENALRREIARIQR